jgi:acetate kinase
MVKDILVLNAGSSSLKFAVHGTDALVCRTKGQVSGIGSAARLVVDDKGMDLPLVKTMADAQVFLFNWLQDHYGPVANLAGVGHRIVHGGSTYVQPCRIDDQVLAALDGLRKLAPLHLPFGLGVLRHVRNLMPHLPHVACFDTAFHATQTELTTRLPIPRPYFDKGYRRYGFHGLNYEHVVDALPKQTGKPLPRRILAAHLGSGASMCAILDGRSVGTTMGFSTADGLVMGTRTGSIDPGVLVALMRDEHLGLDQLEDLLYRRSGLLGLSGISADMKTLLASSKVEAAEAVDYYCYSAARHAASLVPALGGLDAIIFTGGVGENAGAVRSRILSHLEWLSVPEDDVHIVEANEELTIARHVAQVLALPTKQ